MFFFYVQFYANNLFQATKNIKNEKKYCLWEKPVCMCVSSLKEALATLRTKCKLSWEGCQAQKWKDLIYRTPEAL